MQLSRRTLAQITVRLLEHYPAAVVVPVVARQLTQQHAERQLPWFLKEVAAEWLKVRGELAADVVSARRLSTVAQRKLTQLLKQLSGAHTVVLHKKIDRQLIGGFRAETPTMVVDASVHTMLTSLT